METPYGYEVIRISGPDANELGVVLGAHPLDAETVLVQVAGEENPRVVRRADTQLCGQRAPLLREPATKAATGFPWIKAEDESRLRGFNLYTFPMSGLGDFIRLHPDANLAIASYREDSLSPAQSRYHQSRFAKRGWQVDPAAVGGTVHMWTRSVQSAPDLFVEAFARWRAVLVLGGRDLSVAELRQWLEVLGPDQWAGALTSAILDRLSAGEYGLLFHHRAHPYQDDVPVVLVPRAGYVGWQRGTPSGTPTTT